MWYIFSLKSDIMQKKNIIPHSILYNWLITSNQTQQYIYVLCPANVSDVNIYMRCVYVVLYFTRLGVFGTIYTSMEWQ